MTENEHAAPNKRTSKHTASKDGTGPEVRPAASVRATMKAQAAPTGDEDH